MSTDVVAVCVRASSRSNGSDSGGKSWPSAPQVPASVSPSAASSSSRSWARSRMRRGSTSSTRAPGGQEVRQEVLVGGEPRQPRLHAVEHLALGEPLPLLPPPRRLGEQRLGPGPHLGRRQQLTAREHLDVADVVGAALVADRELRQALDLVAPLVDPHRVLGGGGEHVDDRAAHRDLAPSLHLVLAAVAHADEPRDELVAVDRVADPQTDRLAVLDVRAEPLDERPHRRDDDRRRGVAALAQAPHHPQAPAHRLERRRHPFERQGLPRREQLHLVAPEHRDEVAGDALGLRRRRHRDEHRPDARPARAPRPRTAVGRRRARPRRRPGRTPPRRRRRRWRAGAAASASAGSGITTL